MKRFFTFFYFLIAVMPVFSQPDNVKTVTLEINNVTQNGGTVYVRRIPMKGHTKKTRRIKLSGLSL